MKRFDSTGFCASMVLVLLASAPLSAQIVTVSKSGPADETTIQAAITSLAPGGGRDDGDVNNNVVQILDDSIYPEALLVEGMGLTLESTGPDRPRIITSLTDAAANPGSFAIRVDTNQTIVFRGLIFMPAVVSQPLGGFTIDEFTNSGSNVYTAVFEDVLIAGNDGADNPVSLDGRTAPPEDALRYDGPVLDFNSNPVGGNPSVTLLRTIVTGANAPGQNGIRVFTDNGTVAFQEGCVFSYLGGQAVRFSDALDTVATWTGTPAEPIIIHGNDGAGILSNNASTRAVSTMSYVALTRNSLVSDESAIVDLYTGGPANAWSNVTIAGNRAQEGVFPEDGPFSVSTNLDLVNCIIAGGGGEGPRGPRNMAYVNNNAVITADGVCFDLSHGATSLNMAWQRDNSDLEDGVDGADPVPVGAGITGLSPDFISLDPASPDYIATTTVEFRTLGPGGAPLTGAGSFAPNPFIGMVQQSGNLQTYLEGIAVPNAASPDKYSQPNADELMIFKSLITNLLEHELQAASNLAELVNYDLIIFEDTVSSDTFAVLEEKATNKTWRGSFALDLTPERRLVAESPHPLFDGTRIQGIDLFLDTNSMAFMQSGTHRNNSPDVAPCDGTQTNGDPYYLSDMAHNAESFFQGMHEMIHNYYTDTISLSIHGMAEATDPSNVVISNGTGTTTPDPSLSRSIADRMNEILSAALDSRYAVSHQEPGEEPALSGGTNTQGRYSNGSHRPCTFSISALTPERFIHMEQAPTVRNPPSSNWDFVTQTYNELITNFPPAAAVTPEDGSLVASFPLNGDLLAETGQEEGSPTGTVGPITSRTGAVNAAIQFEDSGYATIPDFRYDGVDTEFTLAFWFRMNSTSATGFQYIFSHGSLGRGGEVTMPESLHVYADRAAGQFRVRFTLPGGDRWNFNGPNGVNDGQWRLFTLTYSQTAGATVYLDAVEIANNASHLLQVFDPEGPITIGGRGDLAAERFMAEFPGETGAIDNLRIYNAALAPADIQAIFEETDSGGVYHWSIF